MKHRLFAVFLAAVMLLSALCLSACQDAPDTPEQPDTPEKTAPYQLDRNNVDLTPYRLEQYADGDMINPEPSFARRLTDEEFAADPGENEVMLQMAAISPQLYRCDYTKFAFEFSALPAYDAEKEASYVFHGSRISMQIPSFSESTAWTLLKGRNICDEQDHAFVLDVVAQAEYVPCDPQQLIAEDPCLVVTVDNENGVRDTFLIGHDFRILHFVGDYEYPSEPPVTDISTSRIPLVWFMRLAAMAEHYVYAEAPDSADPLGLARYYETPWDESLDSTLAEAFQNVRVELAYNGKTTALENEDEFKSFFRTFYGDYESRKSGGNRRLLTTVSGTAIPDGALTLTVAPRDAADPYAIQPITCRIAPDGKAYVTVGNYSAMTNGYELGQFFLLAHAQFLSVPELTFPFAELTQFVK